MCRNRNELDNVKKLKYRNEGAYVARFYVRWTTPDGVTCGGYQDYSFYTSSTTKTVTVDLGYDINMLNRFSDINKCKARSDGFGNLKIPEGSRVWGVVEIESGDRVSCKGTKRTIYKNNGGELKYKTQGTTKNNNRCFHTNQKADSTEEE